MNIIKMLLLSPLFILIWQFYNFAITRPRAERERACFGFGITYMAVGTTSFVFRHPFMILLGFTLIMLGLLLLAHGLQRKDKTIFIDRYQEDGHRTDAGHDSAEKEDIL